MKLKTKSKCFIFIFSFNDRKSSDQNSVARSKLKQEIAQQEEQRRDRENTLNKIRSQVKDNDEKISRTNGEISELRNQLDILKKEEEEIKKNAVSALNRLRDKEDEKNRLKATCKELDRNYNYSKDALDKSRLHYDESVKVLKDNEK